MSPFMKIHPVGAELFHEDRQLKVAFRNSANAPKNLPPFPTKNESGRKRTLATLSERNVNASSVKIHRIFDH
jgi:hypothetical protein